MRSVTGWTGASLMVALATLLAGCDTSHRSPMSPQKAASPTSESDLVLGAKLDAAAAASLVRGLYPLAPGNRWHYQRRFKVLIADQSGDPLSETVLRSQVEHTQTCTDVIADRTYLAERIVERGDVPISHHWLWFRQDAGGLYEADLVSSLPPACDGATTTATPTQISDELPAEREAFDRAASGIADPVVRAAFARAWTNMQPRIEVERGLGRGLGDLAMRSRGPAQRSEGELLRLRYPLFPGQSWVIRSDPRLAARVMGLDLLHLAGRPMLGWRIRYRWDMAPDDRILVWYGPKGFLRLSFRSEGIATDFAGNPIGTLIVTEELALDDFDLAGSDRLAASADGD